MIDYISALVRLEVHLSGSPDGVAWESWQGAGDWQQHYSNKQARPKSSGNGIASATASGVYINSRREQREKA